jgi:hypothetical protein
MAIPMNPETHHLTRSILLLALCAGLIFTSASALADGGPLKTYLPGIFTSGCPVFPSNNIWNTPIDKAPLDKNSAAYIQSMQATRALHADFGSPWEGEPIGIPYVVVPGDTPGKSVSFGYPKESDPGPYPIPNNPPIEGGSDRHLLIVDTGNCHLYELFAVDQQPNGAWTAGSGAIFDLRSNALRPDKWTSADAAGLPIYSGLVRYEEFASGAINHAIRITAAATRDDYVWPARHQASSNTSQNVPPMGQRFRLKASFDLSKYDAKQQVFLKAFQKYGLILADNGSNWYVSGAPDDRWDNDWLHSLFGALHGSDFEAVDTTGMMAAGPNSGQAK